MSDAREQAIMNQYPGLTATASGGSTVDTSGSGGSTSGNGNNQDNQNNQTGTSDKHKLLVQKEKLEAQGDYGSSQWQLLNNYLFGPGGAEQAAQARGESVYGADHYTQSQMDQAYASSDTPLTEWQKIYKLAELEAGDPFDEENRYYKSFERQEFEKRMGKQGVKKDDPEWRTEWTYQFGMPSIVATQGRYYGEPIKTGKRVGAAGDDIKYTDEYGQEIGGEYIYSGLGKELMSQLEGATGQTSFDYEKAKDAYWDERTAQDLAKTDQSATSYWDSGGGGGSSGGYGWMLPGPGYKPEQMAGFYTPQANLQQAMVNVHQTPTVFTKRGGIVSLLRLN